MRARALALILVSLGLAACSNGPRPLTGDQLVVVPLPTLPPPNDDAATGYRLGALDVIEVDVFGVEELSRREITLDGTGQLSFPLAGAIQARGKTLDQVAREIEDRLRGRYLRDPHATVNLKQVVSQVATVDGEVREPGLYPVGDGMTLVRLIARAKGTTEFARLSEVVIFRTVGDQRLAALYDLAAIRNGQYADPAIYADDVVVVGDSPARRLFKDILQASPLITTPIIALVQRY